MRSNTGREISNEKRGPTCGANNRAMVKNIKYSVSRLITVAVAHRHKYKFQAISIMGTNDSDSGENIAIATKVVATYIFTKTLMPRL